MSENFLKLDNAVITKGLPEQASSKFITGGNALLPLSKIFLISSDPDDDQRETLYRYLIIMTDGTYISTNEDVEKKLRASPHSIILG